jgi:YVTN family beta-propeller protein
VHVGRGPEGVAVNPAGTKAYVANSDSSTVSVINTATNAVTATIAVPAIHDPDVSYFPCGVAVNPAGTRLYMTAGSGMVGKLFAINTATNTITATVPEDHVFGVAVNPAGTRVYITATSPSLVDVINTATSTSAAVVHVGDDPMGVAVNPAGTNVYVANSGSNTVSVINTGTNTVVNTVNVGNSPSGIAIGGRTLPPGAAFSAYPIRGRVPITVSFTDKSTESPSAYHWNFGDGGTSKDPNPTHKYNEALKLALKNPDLI